MRLKHVPRKNTRISDQSYWRSQDKLPIYRTSLTDGSIIKSMNFQKFWKYLTDAVKGKVRLEQVEPDQYLFNYNNLYLTKHQREKEKNR